MHDRVRFFSNHSHSEGLLRGVGLITEDESLKQIKVKGVIINEPPAEATSVFVTEVNPHSEEIEFLYFLTVVDFLLKNPQDLLVEIEREDNTTQHLLTPDEYRGGMLFSLYQEIRNSSFLSNEIERLKTMRNKPVADRRPNHDAMVQSQTTKVLRNGLELHARIEVATLVSNFIEDMNIEGKMQAIVELLAIIDKFRTDRDNYLNFLREERSAGRFTGEIEQT